MTSTLSVPVNLIIKVDVHEIEGGGFWAEVPHLPGCVAQAESMEVLKDNILQAIDDWWAESPEKTETEAVQLAEIQGREVRPEGSPPQPYDYQPPPDWSDADEE